MKQRKTMKRVLTLLLTVVLVLSTALPAAAVDNRNSEGGFWCSDDADKYAIYPIPQNITYGGKAFELESDVVIVAENGVDQYTMDFLTEILDKYEVGHTIASSVKEGSMNILLGIEGSGGAADTYADDNITITDEELYQKTDAYMLDISEDGIVIEGKNTDSVYYGVATLQMIFTSFNGERFLKAHIEDYATVALRGYIEGFYGSWDFEEREDLMEFARNYKMNSYVYAAKGDSYHTNQWDVLYPDDMLKEFENLVEVGRRTKVEFCWSVHLGSFFRGLDISNAAEYERRYNLLTAKLDQLYNIGVRKFDVLNDDFGGGSHSTVVTVLNRLNKDYIQAKGCKPMSYCPQGYNRAWSGSGEELEALKNLDSTINLYWTGDDVNSPITQDTVNFLRERTNHAPDFWLNYPVNEHARSGIFLGDITYYARDNVTGLYGFHSNPSCFPYASEVGLYQLAALVWNNNDYSEAAQEVWQSAFNYLQPEVRDSYYTIAKNIANAPNSSRVPGFNESEYLADTLKAVQDALYNGDMIGANEEASALIAEFQNILEAISDFKAHCNNKALVSELEPWLNSLRDLVTAGQAALESIIALEDGNISLAWENLSVAGSKFAEIHTYSYVTDGHTYYAKAGSKRLEPFISSAISAATNRLTPIINPDAATVTAIARIGGEERPETSDMKLMYDGDVTTYASWKNINQKEGDYYGLDLGKVIPITDISIVQGKTDTDHDIFHNATLQYSEDKKTWHNLTTAVVDGNYITADNLDIEARYVRYYLNQTGTETKPDYWTFVREFTVNKVSPEYDRVYTNLDYFKKWPLTIDGNEISLRNLEGCVLRPGEYVGIRLKTPEMTSAFTGAMEGLHLEYSYNETEWNDASKEDGKVGAKYFRLINKGSEAVELSEDKISMQVTSLIAEPRLHTSTVANGLESGTYENIFDGDLSTAIQTGSTQAQGTYLTFDLGKTIEVHDVTAVTTDGNEHFNNAKLQISQDNSTWQDIAEVVNGNDTMIVPYRYVYGDGEGALARYLRVYFTGNSSYALKLNEILINQEVESDASASPVTGTLGGNLSAVADGNISTAFSADVEAGDYLEYRISNNTNISQLLILQGGAGTGNVSVLTPNGTKQLGAMTESVSIFDTTDISPITAVRIEWDVPGEASIHEISAVAGAENSTDIGEYTEPIFISGGDTQLYNIAIGKTVTVSGTSDGNLNNVNDGNPSTKWDSNDIKNNPDSFAWVTIDLGTEENYEISQIVVHYFNKIYPTDYLVQISENGETWTDLEHRTHENNGEAHPVDSFEFEKPVTGRYVRLYFDSINTAAAGNGVGVKEFEIFGRKQTSGSTDPEPSEPTNLSLGKAVTVQGTESANFPKENVNDGNTATRWGSDLIKGPNPVAESTWVYIDLGADKTYEISKVIARYYNLVYPMDYKLQISDDANTWRDVEHFVREDAGAAHQADVFELEETITGRYVRLFFEALNPNAAGHGVGVTEFEIYGVAQGEEPEPILPQPPSGELTGIEVTPPAKLTYTVGQDLNTSGMKVFAVYDDDTKVNIDFSVVSVSGYQKDTIGKQTITVTYGGKTATFDVIVEEESATLEEITVTAPKKTEYEIGEKLDLTGMEVKAHYSDGKTETVTVSEEDVTGFDSETAGEKTITVTYEGKTATFTVTIKEAEEPEPSVDKEALNAAIKEAEGKKEADYTEESWKVFADALAKAKEAAEDEDVEQKDVDAAAEELAKAMDALVKAEDVPNPPVEELFEDVRKTDWYYEYVAWAYENDIMKGYDNVKAFGPVDTLKRAQFAQIMYNLAGKPAVEFEDVLGDVREGDWYAEPVVWAYNKGIITGYEDSGLFGASDPITREQIATILYRYADKPAAENEDALKAFPDADKVSGFAKEAMLWAVEQGIITGDKGNLNPGGNANRAEVAAMMQRVVPKLV